MGEYSQYDFTIHSEEHLLNVVKDAYQHGYTPLLVINGMHYELTYLKKNKKED